MRKRTNDFDCVEMKNQIQRRMMAEYEANTEQFASYVDFINKKAEQSDLMRMLKDKINRSKRAA
jgi:hypothetical protein